MPDFVYLASQSPRRQQLLQQIGCRHELLLPGADEDVEALELALPGEAPALYVRRVTLLKVQAAMQRLHQRGWVAAPVLCADTTVALGRRIYGKPAGVADALHMLGELCGKTHRVLTAVALANTHRCELVLSESRVCFAPLSLAALKAYVATGEPVGKAGAYAVQGQAAAFITHISGSHSGIMGLPLFETARLLASFGVKTGLGH